MFQIVFTLRYSFTHLSLFETESHCVTMTDLKLTDSCLPLPNCWHWKCVPLCPPSALSVIHSIGGTFVGFYFIYCIFKFLFPIFQLEVSEFIFLYWITVLYHGSTYISFSSLLIFFWNPSYSFGSSLISLKHL